jgi:hypothetical protein
MMADQATCRYCAERLAGGAETLDRWTDRTGNCLGGGIVDGPTCQDKAETGQNNPS